MPRNFPFVMIVTVVAFLLLVREVHSQTVMSLQTALNDGGCSCQVSGNCIAGLFFTGGTAVCNARGEISKLYALARWVFVRCNDRYFQFVTILEIDVDQLDSNDGADRAVWICGAILP